MPLQVRSMVGLIPLFAVETLEPELLDRLPGFKRRLEWFLENRPDLIEHVASMHAPGLGERRLLVDRATATSCAAMLRRMLDESEFLSPYGIRALSRVTRERAVPLDGRRQRVSASTTSRPSRARRCSAATPTGAGRSGSRSTT